MSSEREDGFTQIFDDVARTTFWETDADGEIVLDKDDNPVVRELGLIGAAVFGVVWRHALMRDKDCHCSLSTMSRLLGISTRSAQRWLRVLEEAGLIEKTQPANLRESEPAHYVCRFVPAVEKKRRAERATEAITY